MVKRDDEAPTTRARFQPPPPCSEEDFDSPIPTIAEVVGSLVAVVWNDPRIVRHPPRRDDGHGARWYFNTRGERVCVVCGMCCCFGSIHHDDAGSVRIMLVGGLPCDCS